PPSYLAPNRLLQSTSVEKATTDLPYELGGTKIGSWGSLRPVGAPKEKPPYDQSSPKNRERRNTRCAQSEWALRYTIPIRTSSPAARCTLTLASEWLLFGTFSFKERKSTPFLLIKGKYFLKSPVCFQNKNILFAVRFSLIFAFQL
ncbi:MAG: hypothetical protein IJD59_04865, partial [Clostridia bacterium]|nr:hypothetical protein [Clostridia bacterium]